MRDHAGVDEPQDPRAQRWRRLEDAILRSPGTLDASVREVLAAGREVPQPLALYVDKVTRHAYRVTDDDVQALLAAGYSQDHIFEATLSVALGAAQTRLQAGLDALRAARLKNEASSEASAEKDEEEE